MATKKTTTTAKSTTPLKVSKMSIPAQKSMPSQKQYKFPKTPAMTPIDMLLAKRYRKAKNPNIAKGLF